MLENNGVTFHASASMTVSACMCVRPHKRSTNIAARNPWVSAKPKGNGVIYGQFFIFPGWGLVQRGNLIHARNAKPIRCWKLCRAAKDFQMKRAASPQDGSQSQMLATVSRRAPPAALRKESKGKTFGGPCQASLSRGSGILFFIIHHNICKPLICIGADIMMNDKK